jgi:hypothetical protein
MRGYRASHHRSSRFPHVSPELLRKPIHYDRAVRRLWIRGQRCHHGATGALLAAGGVVGLVAAKLSAPALAGVLATGGVLMAHDWHDRSLWFARGWQDQP